MAKPEWGIKRICQSCGVRYYDLNHLPITCPTCNTSYDPEAILKSRRSRRIIASEKTQSFSLHEASDLEIENDNDLNEEGNADLLDDNVLIHTEDNNDSNNKEDQINSITEDNVSPDEEEAR
ncbi:TIGR02300 family protein [Candidatus Endolissoclinum faulkneri]|uniref:TIGR02300 family protein n=1 Tax=Candidatus Endolissoclinum faulkneri TaxID=1263979 RepID=UPI0005C5E351|nr:TIGR02300 family protein [Candidatus Endolissoclinum faulkneri]